MRSKNEVSMPHAALWVVQHHRIKAGASVIDGFQCRTRLCGWCNAGMSYGKYSAMMFQCRTRLCGWCNEPSRPRTSLLD